MSHARLLLVEDDPAIRFAVRDFMETHGYAVLEARTLREAESVFGTQMPSVVVSDYKLPDGNALELLPRLRAVSATTPFIVLTGHGTVELAVEAMRAGADDFLTKPVALPALLVVVERALERQRDRQNLMARQLRQKRAAVDPFIGNSQQIKRLRETAERVAGADRPILILGETGAGKGVLTRWIHTNGPRASEAFVDLNCASLPRELLESELFGYERGAFTGAVNAKMGLVELANRGTLFLDEIGDLELALQPKLLKVLEEQSFRRVGAVKDRQVDVRLIAATHQELPNLVKEGRFRGDLYFRISTIPLSVPALRTRAEDIPVLARHLLERMALEMGRPGIGLAPEAERALAAYTWPGNIRELRNVLERAVLMSGRADIHVADLAFDSVAPAERSDGGGESLDITLEELQRRHIARVLASVQGHVEQAAQKLGIPRSTLYQKVKAMQIAVPRAKGRGHTDDSVEGE